MQKKLTPKGVPLNFHIHRYWQVYGIYAWMAWCLVKINHSKLNPCKYLCAGFVFSEEETTALIQLEGGPCAVIAPVQAFLLKNALFTSRSKTSSDFSTVTGRKNARFSVMSLNSLFSCSWPKNKKTKIKKRTKKKKEKKRELCIGCNDQCLPGQLSQIL